MAPGYISTQKPNKKVENDENLINKIKVQLIVKFG